MARTVVTPVGRASFPAVFTPRAVEEGGKAQYSISLLFDAGTDLSELKALAKETAVEKWGPDPKKWPANVNGKMNPFKKGEDKPDLDGYGPGVVFINARSNQKIGVAGPDAKPMMDQSQFYAGCMCRALVMCYAYENKWGKGISFGLQHVQKVGEGEPFDGRVPVDQAFDPVEGAAQDASDPFSGGDGGAAESDEDMFG